MKGKANGWEWEPTKSGLTSKQEQFLYTALILPGTTYLPHPLRCSLLWKTSCMDQDLQKTTWGCANLISLTISHSPRFLNLKHICECMFENFLHRKQRHGDSFKARQTQATSDSIEINCVHVLLSGRLINGCVLSMGEVLLLFLYIQILPQSPDHSRFLLNIGWMNIKAPQVLEMGTVPRTSDTKSWVSCGQQTAMGFQ